MTKICSKCKMEKEENEFHKDKSSKDGLVSKCKTCCKKQQKQYYLEHKDKIKQYQLERKDEIKQYYLERKNEIKKQQKQYQLEHKDEIVKRVKQYQLEHKDEISKQHNKYLKQRRKIDSCYKLRCNISYQIWYYLKSQNFSKSGASILQYLPYTIPQLKEHLESQFESWMTWENYGAYEEGKQKWNIDHIIPQSTLLYKSMDDPNFQKCWALENLRPFEALENIKKGNKINEN